MIMVNKLILGVIASLVIVGCGDYQGNTSNYDESGQDRSYTFIEGDKEFGDGTYLFCTDSNCSTIDSSKNTTGVPSEPNAIVGKYDENYTQAECNAAGFFYCTVEDKCLNQRVDDSSSSCSK